MQPPPHEPGWISARIVRGTIAAAADAGADADELRARVGLNDGPDALDATVSVEQHYRLWAHLQRTLRDPGLPVRAAARRSTGDLQIRGFAAATSRDGWEACDRAIRYGRLTTNTLDVTLERADDHTATLSFLRDAPRTLGVRVALECAMWSWVTQMRRVLDEAFMPSAVYLQHDLPADREALTAHVGPTCELCTGASRDALVFDAAVLACKPASANPAMRAFFDAQAKAMLATMPSGPSPLHRALQAKMAQMLPSGPPRMADVAAALGHSERSLRRALEQEGSNFTDVLRAVRLDLARVLLADPGKSIGDVSFALGFSEQSAFSRFFRAQTGENPREHRARTLAQAR